MTARVLRFPESVSGPADLMRRQARCLRQDYGDDCHADKLIARHMGHSTSPQAVKNWRNARVLASGWSFWRLAEVSPSWRAELLAMLQKMETEAEALLHEAEQDHDRVVAALARRVDAAPADTESPNADAGDPAARAGDAGGAAGGRGRGAAGSRRHVVPEGGR